jgi:hypothetical protein
MGWHRAKLRTEQREHIHAAPSTLLAWRFPYARDSRAQARRRVFGADSCKLPRHVLEYPADNQPQLTMFSWMANRFLAKLEANEHLSRCVA